MAETLARPVMLFDGRCAFCRRWVERWKAHLGEAVDFEPSQVAGPRFPQIDPAGFGKAVYLAEPDGRISHSAEAVFRALALSGKYAWLWQAYEFAPGFALVSEAFYRVVASHRDLFDWLDMRLIGPGIEPASYRLTRQIFLRLLGVVYFIAFVSLWVQIDGLIGSRGILPVREFLAAVYQAFGRQGFWGYPTLCWFSQSDAMLHWLCGGGAVLAVLVVLGIAQLPALILLFVCYLSLTTVGQDFLGYQWDSLLLETGFLAIFFAPLRLWPSRRPGTEPSWVVRWLLRWLLFRLMLMSGVVKLSSGDVAWRSLAALRYHYMTQPLPNWVSWYFEQGPNWFQAFSCGVVFFAELVVPFLIFTPRRLRILGFWMLVIFQLLITLTGNYGFFNILAIALCCVLPDDAFWRWILRRGKAATAPNASPRGRKWITAPLAVVYLAASLPVGISAFRVEVPWPSFVEYLDAVLGRFGIVNSYGLFAVMTTTRPELIIEGSDDGVSWKPYEFKWKMGDLGSRPAFATPHMPRLDWQLWFAALYAQAGDTSNNQWLAAFMQRLLENSPPVIGLLKTNPFPDQPPRFVRTMLFDYKFTNFQERGKTGNWWKRTEIGEYFETSSFSNQGASE